MDACARAFPYNGKIDNFVESILLMSHSGHASDQDALTDREQEILLLMSEGRSNHDIAAQLHLTHGTVKWYASQIYRKLNVRNRAEAVARIHQHNLIDDAGPLSSPEKVLKFVPNRPQLGQTIRIMTSFDGAQIAYAISGAGPPFVEAAHFMRHLEYEWESPIYRHLLLEFMREHTLIRYDKRGTGMSDWDVADLSFEAWVRDLEALVETVGAERFPLFGKSQAASVAIAYAARNPDRVSHLILLGGYARGYGQRDLTPEQIEEIELKFSLVKVGFNSLNPAYRHAFAVSEFPNGPVELVREMEKFMQVSTTAENIIRMGQSSFDLDLSDLAQQIKVPTLVFHAVNDQVVPFAEGRFMASLIPGAQFVPLDTMNHLLVEGEPAWVKFQETLRRFLKSHA